MAHTLYLKAIEDISVGHLFTGNSAYESIQDYTFVTPIYIHTSDIDASTNASATATSIFKLGVVDNTKLKDIKVNNVAFFCRHSSGSNITSTCGVSISVNGSQVYTNSAISSSTEVEISSLIDILNSNFQSNIMPEILMTLTSTATASASVTESSLEKASIIAAYLVVDYNFINAFYFRPSADISVQHTIAPSSLAAGYLAICEEISDEDSTYISSLEQPEAHTEVSEFRLSGTVPSEKINIVNLYIVVAATNVSLNTTENSCTVTIGDKSQTVEISAAAAGTGGYTVLPYALGELLDPINAYIKANGVGSFPDVIVSITSYNEDCESSKGNYPCTKISQVYLEVVYQSGLNIHTKSNGIWKQAQAAYQKQNGAWVEITEDECKTILQSGFIVRGD